MTNLREGLLYNTEGYIYISGNEKTNNSRRFTINEDDNILTVEKRIAGIWRPTDVETKPVCGIFVGRRVGVTGIGHHLGAKDINDIYHFHAHADFDGHVSINDAKIAKVYNFQSRKILQSDNTGVYTGTNFESRFYAISSVLTQQRYFQTGLTEPTTPVTIKIYEIDTGHLIFSQTYTASMFTANSEIILPMDGYFETDAGKTYFLKITSTTPFSIKTNANGTAPWVAVDDIDIREDDMLQVKPWISGDTFAMGQWSIQSNQIYMCNIAGIQTGTFASNLDKWDILGDQYIDNVLTPGSIAFGGSNGKLAEDNTNLFWDNSSKIFALGVASFTVNSIEIVGADGEVNKAAVEDSGNWDSAYTHSQIAGGDSVHVSTTENTQWDSAYTHSQIAGGDSVHVSTTENTQWDTAYTHSQNNSQAHSDYLLNSGDDETSGTLTAAGFATAGSIAGASLIVTDLTEGSIPFIGASGVVSQNKDNLFWDDGNNRLGIGTTSPARMFHVQGNNALWRLDRDANSPALSLHRFPSGDFSTPLKGFILGVTASGADEGSFFIGDWHQNVSGGSDVRLTIDTNGKITIPGALDIGASPFTVNSIEIVGADGEINKAAVEDSGNWDIAYSHSQIAVGDSVHVSTTENTQWDTAYTHSQDNSQAHSDYLVNSGDDETSGTLTAANFTTAGSITGASLTVTGLTEGSISFIGTSGLFTQDNSKLFWNNTNKRLGIGTATPSTILHTYGAGDQVFTIESSDDNQATINFRSNSVQKGLMGYNETANCLTVTHSESGTSKNDLALIIKEFQVGIKTTSPLEPLTIDVASNTYGGLEITNSNSESSAQAGIILRTVHDAANKVGTTGTYGWQLTARSDTYTTSDEREDLVLEYHDGSSWRGVMFFEHDTGNIGLGVINPAQKLDVAGNIYLSGGTKNYLFQVVGDDLQIGPVTDTDAFRFIGNGATTAEFNVNLTVKGVVSNDIDYSSFYTDRSLVDKEYADYNSILAKTAMTTGLTEGGLLTQTGPTTLSWTAGEGYQADYTDPTNPTITRISWNAVSNYTPANIAIPGQYTIAYGKTGSVTEFPLVGLDSRQVRDYIVIGGYGTNGSMITRVAASAINIGYNTSFTVKDFLRDVIGPANVEGNIISANGSNLKLDRSAGKTFIQGANFRNDKEITDEVPLTATTAFYFQKLYRASPPSQDMLVDGPPYITDTVDPAKWDDGSGTLQTITGNKYSVQVVYVTHDGYHMVAYGQELFNTASEAEEALVTGVLSYEEYPFPRRLVRRSFLIVKSNETDLSSATFLAEGKFRIIGAASGGGGVKLHSSLQKLEWDVAGHLFEDAGVFDIGNYSLVSHGKGEVASVQVAGAGAGAALTTGYNNTIYGVNAGDELTIEADNTFIGYESGKGATGLFLATGIGVYALKDADGATRTVAIGGSSGELATASECVYLGFGAGASNTTDNKLIISNINNMLIEGDFSNQWCKIHGDFIVNDGIRNRIQSDATHIGLHSPDGSNKIIINNIGLFLTEDGSIRISIDGTKTELLSPSMSINIVVSDLDVKITGELQVREDASHTYVKIDTDNDTAYDSGIRLQNNGVDQWVIYSDNGDGNLYFNENTADTRMTIEAGGNVNIATDLTVGNDILFSGTLGINDGTRDRVNLTSIASYLYSPDGTARFQAFDSSIGLVNGSVTQVEVTDSGSYFRSPDGTSTVLDINNTNAKITGEFETTGTISAGGNILSGGQLHATGTGDGTTLLRFETDRRWVFQQEGSGSGTALRLRNLLGQNKHFYIDTNGYTRWRSYNGATTYMTHSAGNLNLTGDLTVGDDIFFSSAAAKIYSSGSGGYLEFDTADFLWRDVGNAVNRLDITSVSSYLRSPDGGTYFDVNDGALECNSTSGALLLTRMTTIQRDALTAVNGMIMYNTTTNAFNFYENSSWVIK